MNADARLGALRRRMAEERVDALLVTGASDQRWATGLDGVFDEDPGTVCLITTQAARLFADGRYIEAAREASGGSPWAIHEAALPARAALDIMRDEGAERLALQPSLSWTAYTDLAEAFGGDVVPATRWVGSARLVKEAHEIERIEAAAAITDAAFEHILGVLAVGKTEAAIALALEVFMREAGSQGVAFAPIVASGPNSARPHAIPTERPLASDDFVKLDFGARVGGYCADMTRTVVLGTASQRQRTIHGAVLEANEAAVAACRPGVTGSELHAVAVDVLTRHRMAELFSHGLGHGVGLDVHEGPRLNSKSEDVMASGMVVTIEPGVYEPGFGGVRIEDLVVIEDGGCRVLTRSRKTLIEIQGR